MRDSADELNQLKAEELYCTALQSVPVIARTLGLNERMVYFWKDNLDWTRKRDRFLKKIKRGMQERARTMLARTLSDMDRDLSELQKMSLAAIRPNNPETPEDAVGTDRERKPLTFRSAEGAAKLLMDVYGERRQLIATVLEYIGGDLPALDLPTLALGGESPATPPALPGQVSPVLEDLGGKVIKRDKRRKLPPRRKRVPKKAQKPPEPGA